MSKIFSLNYKNILGALISAFLVGIIAILFYVSANYTSIVWFQTHPILSAGLLAFIGSLIKAFTTDNSGNFAGVVPVK